MGIMMSLKYRYSHLLLDSLKWPMAGNRRNSNYPIKKDKMISCYFVLLSKDNILRCNLFDIFYHFSIYICICIYYICYVYNNLIV